ncbi:hypothetical protein [Legionella jamestowniensis]|uniref:Uncharacterized protein n=1 Tax=Legionella jamestowniensis TaxID=455 RepID=A0A0W0UIK1_9GAMM|nr:hypothetical protein [Legionella jamestowniensis]KTD07688.1 hypothetical protein Ljam_1883 [Legionella jamestowniensis]SFL60679.1 hypothetical protein SAMN02746073_1002 [Legionella jamestowniensis DSM 19215]
MEIQNERVFAYTFAKTIEHGDLDKVSGGSSQGTVQRTFLITGGSGPITDVKYDVNQDH